MTEVNVANLKGIQLDWAVLSIEDPDNLPTEDMLKKLYALSERMHTNFELRMNYSKNWSLAGPIIEREMINLENPRGFSWTANVWVEDWSELNLKSHFGLGGGDSATEAAMMCFVNSKVGDKIHIPDILLDAIKETNGKQHKENDRPKKLSV